MAIAETAAPHFEMGRVVRRTFSVIGKNFGTFVLISIIPGLTWAATEVAGNQFEADIAAASFPNVNTILVFAFWFLIYLASAMMLQGGVIHGAVASLNGNRASLGECLATGLKYLVPLFLIGLLATLGILAGMVLLFVPGIILAVMWVGVGPACVVEHTGVSGAFSRSRQLTRGYRWQIFGLYVALFVLALILTLVGGVLVGVLIGVGMFAFSPDAAAAAATTDTNTAEAVVNGISTMLSSIVGSALGASTYYELRQIKEGIGPEALASVFD